MANLEMTCTSCGKKLRCSPVMRGHTITCPSCQAKIAVPAGGDAAAANVAVTEAAMPVTVSGTIRASGATSSLVCAILGFFCAGIILGPIAISQARGAIAQIGRDPRRYTGYGLAKAGLVIGWIDVIGWAISMLFLVLSAMGR